MAHRCSPYAIDWQPPELPTRAVSTCCGRTWERQLRNGRRVWWITDFGDQRG